MRQPINVTATMSTESFSGRNVYFKVKLVNNDDIDYYIYDSSIDGAYNNYFMFRGSAINALGENSGSSMSPFEWISCSYSSDPMRNINPAHIMYDHIPSGGEFEKNVHIIHKCSSLFKYIEAGSYMVAYENAGISLLDAVHRHPIGSIYIPSIELGFELID